MKRNATLFFTALALAAAPAVFGQGSPSKKQFVKTDLMTGYQEVVAGTISSIATGEFVAEIDDEADIITYTLTYANIEGGGPTVAHIHFGARGTTGGVSAFLCGGGGKPPCPPVSGSVTDIITRNDVVGPNAQGIEATNFEEFVLAIRSGVTYVNVHSTRFPGGEIRGQIHDHNERQVK